MLQAHPLTPAAHRRVGGQGSHTYLKALHTCTFTHIQSTIAHHHARARASSWSAGGDGPIHTHNRALPPQPTTHTHTHTHPRTFGTHSQLVDEWGRGFVAETDYRLEAKNTRDFEASMKARGLDAVCAPTVVADLVRDTVLVTEWVEGTRCVAYA